LRAAIASPSRSASSTTSARRAGGRGYAADYRIAVEAVAVTDESGAALETRELYSGSNLVLRIGDPDRTITGQHEYRIRYRVRRGVLWLEDHDEIYWNATGNEWSAPIAAASARVYLPAGVDSQSLQARCFTGAQGSVATDCATQRGDGSIAFVANRPLAAGEGLSFVLALPKGVLPEPPLLRRRLERGSDFLSGWLLLPVAAFGAMFSLWRRHGRDPESPHAAIAVRYEPPEGLAPAELGTVLDERVDLGDVTATIVDLAVHGFLRIHEEESRALLFFSQRDYVLEKLREPEGRKPFERLLVERLFALGDRVRVSELRNEFYRDLPDVQQSIYAGLSGEARFFAGDPAQVKRRWGVIGGAIAALGIGLFALSQSLAAGASGVAAGLIVLGFAPAMPRRTARGRRALDEIRGFREFLERVERDRLEREGALTRERFEAILPYAIVLGCADAWADAFADVYQQPPDWYDAPRHRGGVFSPRAFVGDMGRGLTTIGAAMTAAPRSAGSGRSGFGGGGFSGGGFGGGGGRSW
jgi:hypothetical protein